ncbi:MAG: hypothetical protein JWN10_1169 [Solirubrobacterales bacterium]|nr:hypothetical protein [Solirubrobacterales bacterium]
MSTSAQPGIDPVSLAPPVRAPVTDQASEPAGTVLIDFDNFFPGEIAGREQLDQDLRRAVDCALDVEPALTHVEVRLYGGWLENGILTRRASELQAQVGAPSFAARHPRQPGLLRVSTILVTRLAAIVDLEWGHTLRSRLGLPQLRLAETPRPADCVDHEQCPVRIIRSMSRGQRRLCSIDGCTVVNADAFLVREQKMVDSLLVCDTISYSQTSSALVVLSNDLDVLPGLVQAANSQACVSTLVLVRAVPEHAVGLYDAHLERMGVVVSDWARNDG